MCVYYTTDDRRIISSGLLLLTWFAFCLSVSVFTFSRSLSLKYFIKKAFAIVLQKLVSHILSWAREPHIKKSAVSELFFLISLYIKLMKEFRLICAH